MDHLAPSLRRDERPCGEAGILGGRRTVGHDELAVAARPVGAAESRVVQSHPRAEHHDGEREHGAEPRETYEDHVHQFDPDAESKRFKSRKSSFCSTSAG